MAAKIREVANIDDIEMIPSRGGAFEIRVNDELLHSKLRTREWPDFDAVAQQVKARLAQ